MREHTYTKFSPEMGDAVDLQSLLDGLADFLLQSGFAGGAQFHPYWGETGEDQDKSLDALRQAILDALLKSGQFTPEMLEALRGEGDDLSEQKLSDLLDSIVKRLVDEGYLNLEAPPEIPAGHQSVTGPGGLAQAAARDVQFSLTDRGIDFLGYKSLRGILSSLGKSSFGSHDTPHLATGIESDAWSRPYEFGDVLNLDVNETLRNAMLRTGSLDVPIDLDYPDLMVRQSEYRSSCATVLMLDCSHSMILYGEDRFTEIPIGALAGAQVGPYHTNTAQGLKLARRLLLAQKKDMRQIVMITDGKPSALTMPDGRIYKNAMGLDAYVLQQTLAEVTECRRAGIVVNTFMLARDRALVEFVKIVSSITRGRAYFTNTMTLGQFILMDFLKRKTRKVS